MLPTTAPSHWALAEYNHAYALATLAEVTHRRAVAHARRTNSPAAIEAAEEAADALADARDDLAHALLDLCPLSD